MPSEQDPAAPIALAPEPTDGSTDLLVEPVDAAPAAAIAGDHALTPALPYAAERAEPPLQLIERSSAEPAADDRVIAPEVAAALAPAAVSSVATVAERAVTVSIGRVEVAWIDPPAVAAAPPAPAPMLAAVRTQGFAGIAGARVGRLR